LHADTHPPDRRLCAGPARRHHRSLPLGAHPARVPPKPTVYRPLGELSQRLAGWL